MGQIDLMIGEANELKSFDSVAQDSQHSQFPAEFLNTLNIWGIPLHKLILKSGQPIIMLRNLSSTKGLCNGTRLIVKNIYKPSIEEFFYTRLTICCIIQYEKIQYGH